MTDPRIRVQRNGRDTSWDAALLQTPEKTAKLYRRIRRELERSGPATDEELLAALREHYPADKFSDSGVRSRRNELVGVGWVTEDRLDSGEVIKRRGSTGTQRIVWRAVLEGEEAPAGSAEPSAAEVAHNAGMAAARRYAEWHIGDRTWAGGVIRAYLEPAKVSAELDEEGAP